MSITLQELRDRIATALASELGTKTYGTRSSSTEVQALTIDDGNVKTVAGRRWEQKPIKHTGLECVIEPEIDSNIQPLITPGDYFLTHTTRITLKQFDVTDTVKTARSLLLQELGSLIDVIGPRITRNPDIKSVEQQSFDIIQNARS